MNINLDLNGMSFEQQKELLLLQKDILKLEHKKIEDEKKSVINKKLEDEAEEILEYNMWQDYIKWCEEWKSVLKDDNERYDYRYGMSPNRYNWIQKYGKDYKDKIELSPRDYYMNEYTIYGGIKMPKNPNKKDEQFDRFIDGVERIGTVLLDGAIINNSTLDFVELNKTGLLSQESYNRYNNYTRGLVL